MKRYLRTAPYEGDPPRLVTIRNVRQRTAEWLAFKQRCRELGIPTHEGVRQALYAWMMKDVNNI